MMRRGGRWCAALGVLAAVAAGARAEAQPRAPQASTPPAAGQPVSGWQVLLERAFQESNQGRHADALRLGGEAGTLRMTPGVRLFLAEEHEYLGQEPGGAQHFLDAEREAQACIDDATAQPALERRERILRDCANLRERMNQRLVHVQVRVASPPPGAQVQLDGVTLPERDWGRVHARVPGQEITVSATAPGRVPFRRTFRPMSPVSEVVEVALPEVSVERVVQTQVVERSPSGALRVAGISLLVAGVVAGGIGVWQAIATSAQTSDAAAGSGEFGPAWTRYENTVNFPVRGARPLSTEQVCDRAATEASANPDAAQVRTLCESNATARALAWGFGVGGAVLAGVGVTLLVVSATSRPRATSVGVAPMFLAGGGGAVVDFRF